MTPHETSEEPVGGLHSGREQAGASGGKMKENTVCPYCGSNWLHHFKNGISIYPELGRNAFMCINCRGLFGVEEDVDESTDQEIK